MTTVSFHIRDGSKIGRSWVAPWQHKEFGQGGYLTLDLGDDSLTIHCPRSRARDLANQLTKLASALVTAVDSREEGSG